jgi:hypothetical protein
VTLRLSASQIRFLLTRLGHPVPEDDRAALRAFVRAIEERSAQEEGSPA